MPQMKLFCLLALMLSSCATNKVVAPSRSILIQEKEDEHTTLLMMTERVFTYGPNSSVLSPKDKEELSKIIQDVVNNQDQYKRIEIVGHSDQTGTEDSNLKISRDRAISILEMMKEAGIDRKKIRTSWLAGTEPIDLKYTSANRRVEIRFFEKKRPSDNTN
jgi:outer membrane protein OmpA-like peptidoglycan-associated protein